MNPAIKGADQEAVARFREQLGKARKHVEFCCKLYEYQLKRGAHFVHEHPWGAKSWDMECVTKLIHNEDVMIAMVDQCRFGLETSGEDGSIGPARKRTGFMSSSWTVIEELDGACNGLHKRHNHLIDGRAKEAEVYPPELCRAICRGVARQKAIDESGAYSSAPMSERQLSTVMSNCRWKDDVHEEEGGYDRIGPRQQDGRNIMKEETGKLVKTIRGLMGHTAWDDVTGGEPIPAEVQEARQ